MLTSRAGRGIAAVLATATLVLGTAGPSLAGADPAWGPVTAGSTFTAHGGYAIAVDSRRGLVYMADHGNGPNGVTVYDEATDTTSDIPLTTPDTTASIAVDEGTGDVYVPGGPQNSSSPSAGVVTVLRAGHVVGTV